MRTVRGRLIAVTVLLVVGATILLAVYSGHLSVNVIRDARRDDQIAALVPLRSALLQALADSGWEGLRRRVADVARLSGRQLLLTDASGQLAAAAPIAMQPGDFSIDAAGTLTGWRLDIAPSDSSGRRPVVRGHALGTDGGLPGIEITNPAGDLLGRLYALPASDPENEGASTTATYRPIAFAAAAIAVGAVLFTLLLSRRVLGPVERLTAAATAMAGGDLDQRVPLGGRDEIAALASAFNSMAGALQHTRHLRRAMTNDIAHELRTPLTHIRCTVESLADGMVTFSPAVVESLQEEVQLLQRLIDDLQDLALTDVGELRLHRERLDARVEAEASVRAMETEATTAGVELRVVVDGSAQVDADRERLQQMLRNLIRNAITHTAPGGSVVVSTRGSEGHDVEFSVRDTGSGIAPEHVADIFQRFYRVDPSRSRGTGGAGLGLAIVKGLAEAHRGRVVVESVVGQGSTFRVLLPMSGAPQLSS